MVELGHFSVEQLSSLWNLPIEFKPGSKFRGLVGLLDLLFGSSLGDEGKLLILKVQV
jgi:hypothetical protein